MLPYVRIGKLRLLRNPPRRPLLLHRLRWLNDNLGLLQHAPRGPPNLKQVGPMIPAIASVYSTNNVSSANKWGRFVAYWLINSHAVTWPFTLTIVGQNIAGLTKRAATNVLLFMAFSAGNIAGPFYLRERDALRYGLAIQLFWCAVNSVSMYLFPRGCEFT
ncbi:hypothetical protein BJX65DRAFT_84547 [Aspergillus insuetus]